MSSTAAVRADFTLLGLECDAMLGIMDTIATNERDPTIFWNNAFRDYFGIEAQNATSEAFKDQCILRRTRYSVIERILNICSYAYGTLFFKGTVTRPSSLHVDYEVVLNPSQCEVAEGRENYKAAWRFTNRLASIRTDKSGWYMPDVALSILNNKTDMDAFRNVLRNAQADFMNSDVASDPITVKLLTLFHEHGFSPRTLLEAIAEAKVSLLETMLDDLSSQ